MTRQNLEAGQEKQRIQMEGIVNLNVSNRYQDLRLGGEIRAAEKAVSCWYTGGKYRGSAQMSKAADLAGDTSSVDGSPRRGRGS